MYIVIYSSANCYTWAGKVSYSVKQVNFTASFFPGLEIIANLVAT